MRRVCPKCGEVERYFDDDPSDIECIACLRRRLRNDKPKLLQSKWPKSVGNDVVSLDDD